MGDYWTFWVEAVRQSEKASYEVLLRVNATATAGATDPSGWQVLTESPRTSDLLWWRVVRYHQSGESLPQPKKRKTWILRSILAGTQRGWDQSSKQMESRVKVAPAVKNLVIRPLYVGGETGNWLPKLDGDQSVTSTSGAHSTQPPSHQYFYHARLKTGYHIVVGES